MIGSMHPGKASEVLAAAETLRYWATPGNAHGLPAGKEPEKDPYMVPGPPGWPLGQES